MEGGSWRTPGDDFVECSDSGVQRMADAVPKDVGRIGRLMRHSRFTTTAEIYEQDLPESQIRAVEKLSTLVQ